MSSLFAWVPWFRELVQKIIDGGPNYLATRAEKIPWNADGTRAALLKYGDENVDPFSFIRFLASKNDSSHWKRVHPEVSAHFGLTTGTGSHFDDGFYFPAARQQLLFHHQGTGDPNLYWRLFRAAAQGPDHVRGADFDRALARKRVGVAKLTQTLFLINPDAFLPIDPQSMLPLRKDAYGVKDWDTYRGELQAVLRMFPGCSPYEIQHFAYAVFGREDLKVNSGEVWQSSTLVDGDEEDRDYWPDFRENGWIYHRGPGEGKSRRLHEPVRGDIVLVRTRMSEGRGIAVVERNDHKESWEPDQRLHVLWLNTARSQISLKSKQAAAFSAAGVMTDAFRNAPAYVPTFDLLKRLGWDAGTPLPGPTPKPGPNQPPDLKSLAKETLITESELRRVVELLEDKKQVIFQGPPGTGKTYLARKLAEYLAGSLDRVRLVQFHPSYSYEDFVQGYRPTLKDGHATFKRRKGPLLQIARRAAKDDKTVRYFLVIDEINRGNLSKILGELYFLLEYRDETVHLQHSRTGFRLPENLYLIGTMNTADRSIALVDLALRRRFHFVEFHPDRGPIKGLLGRWLAEHELRDFLWLERVLEKANEELRDHHAAIGPSYFMPKDKKLDDERIRIVWKHNVLPYIEERLFGQEERLKDFDLDKLREKASKDNAADDASEGSEAGAPNDEAG